MKFNTKTKILFISVFIFSGLLILSQTLQIYMSKLLLDETILSTHKNITLNITLFIFSILFCLFCEFMRKDITAKLKKELLVSLRSYACKGIQLKKSSKFLETNIQEYISIFNNDIENIVEDYYLNLPVIYFQILSIVIYSFFLFMLNPVIAIIITLSNVLTVLTPYLFSKKIQNGKIKYLDWLKKYNVNLGDFLKGQLVIRTNNIDDIYDDILNDKSHKSAEKEYTFNRLVTFSDMTTGSVSYLGYILTFICGILMIGSKKLTFGGLLASIQTSDLLVGPSISLASQINYLNGMKSIKSNFFKSFSSEETIKNINLDKIDSISLENVNYKYESGFEISDITYTFYRGKKYLIYGGNGSGKSTIFKLLLNIVSPDTGKVIVNDINLEKVSNTSYYKNVGIVLQDPFLFNDTLINNLTLFRDYDKNKIIEILRNLNLDHLTEDIFSNRLYHENKSNISGGEKQKICLARVLLENKKFIFLDEATASIDNNSSEDIENLILKNSDIGIVNIEHKINKNLVKFYDEIICMHDGKINKIIKTDEEKENFINGLYE
ncbi:ABC transporter ATP-binding protein [Paraclostridium bifermentans]|uniref:ABC transporter ATP-binding protein n=1 Tax=Paraclostridium bifermentans TaxID=1490 RepID=UPI0022E6C060|nr:ABC transporter ATP-binding protein [Paraclostridium bifermentans]